MITPVPEVTALSPYATPKLPETVDLRLDVTERPLPLDVGEAGAYPKAVELEKALGERFGVEPRCVLVTAGADEALDRACRAYLSSARVAVLTTPTFEMIRHYARLAGAAVREVPWYDGTLEVSRILEATRDVRGICAICSPNNPTGLVAEARAFVDIAKARPDVLVIADFAYIELAAHDPTRELLQLPNVVVTRTFSKAWGIPGARVGYALASSEIIAAMRVAGGPYAVARPSLALALARLRTGESEMQAYVARVRDEVAQVSRLLAEHAIEVSASQASFVLMRGPKVPDIAAGLAKRGIGTRAFPNDPALADARRMAVPADATVLARLTKALRDAIAEVA